jgi:monomeric sarcosine oxidase
MAMASRHYPVIVLGGGTMGSAAAWELGKRGIPALVLEQFGHVHDQGSHGGQTRIIRHAYAESPDYVPIVVRADDLWVELEAETGRRFFHRIGCLDLAAPGYGHARSARASAERWGLPFEWLDGAEVRRRYPAWTIPDEWEACFDPRAGYLEVEPALRAFGEAAQSRGVTTRDHEPARAWRVDGDGVVVETDRGTYSGDRLIVTAGAWAGRTLAALGLPLTVLRKPVWWFGLADPAPYDAARFPVWIAASGAGELYGFPLACGEVGLKVAQHSGGEAVDPATVDREAHDAEAVPILAASRQMLRGLTGAITKRTVCLYTMTPDTDFIVDRHPEHGQVVFGAGFSGHGFKFASAIGAHLVALALDAEAAPYPHLALGRLLAPA